MFKARFDDVAFFQRHLEFFQAFDRYSCYTLISHTIQFSKNFAALYAPERVFTRQNGYRALRENVARFLVEPKGLEPSASGLQSPRSPS